MSRLSSLIAGVLALTVSACSSKHGAFVNYYYDHPIELQRALNRLAEYQDQVEKRRILTLITNNMQWLYSADSKSRIGNQNASIQVAMFSDYNCAVCKSALKSILADPRIESGSLSVVVHELPILSPTSLEYARLSDRAAASGRFVEFLSGMIAIDHLSVETANRLAARLGIDVRNAQDGGEAAAFAGSTGRNMAFFKACGGSGTPMFVTKDGVHRGWNISNKPF